MNLVACLSVVLVAFGLVACSGGPGSSGGMGMEDGGPETMASDAAPQSDAVPQGTDDAPVTVETDGGDAGAVSRSDAEAAADGGACTPGETQCVALGKEQTCGTDGRWDGAVSCTTHSDSCLITETPMGMEMGSCRTSCPSGTRLCDSPTTHKFYCLSPIGVCL